MAKKKRKKSTSKKVTPKSYIRNHARSLPIDRCYISSTWESAKKANVIVIRKHTTGFVTVGVFLVDLLYEGLKDSLYMFNLSEHEFKDRFTLTEEFIEIDYVFVHNLIWGAVDYFEKTGKEFTITQYILEEDNEAIEFMDFDFGEEIDFEDSFDPEKEESNRA